MKTNTQNSIVTLMDELPYIEVDDQAANHYITEELIYDALNSKDFSKLNKAVVVPSEDGNNDILFENDYWTNEVLGKVRAKTVRGADFSKLSTQLKFESKIIGASFLYTTGKKAKTSSIMRKISQLIQCGKILDKANVLSYFHLDQAPIRDRFLAELKQGKKNGTVDNLLKVFTSVCKISQTKYGKLGFTLRTNMIVYSPGRTDSNQTYCMPFRMLTTLWGSFMEYFKSLELQPNELAILSKAIVESGKEWRELGLKRQTQERFEKFQQRNYRNELKNIHDNGSNIAKGMVIHRSQNEIEKLKNKVFTFAEKKTKNWNTYAEYRIDREVFFSHHQVYLSMAAHTIQSMTGMRISEIRELTHDALIIDGSDVGVRSILHKFSADEEGDEEHWAAAPFVKDIFEHALEINSAVTGLNKEELKVVPLFFNLKNYLN
ncbi:MAG: hypothetical protein KZQ74_04385 [gamma proteobacterium symbiont of Bathyaustriella thionipta]|nr:hypothetical protein [gamma proteobacterium symbiont of Bathyaustriella thionipta]MCU7951532.1 hypothetical protein [gamma proteobacterium symbiont of Bathyaustriella thionipta]MCU7958114.1 hypothetical protein [gamma proteobacterium symbiont of Bathyaustriella thionipta]MCU7966426.1 hypothetical protein [gamma proteobacterium symbiont of Bathyaustriella thionipta]